MKIDDWEKKETQVEAQQCALSEKCAWAFDNNKNTTQLRWNSFFLLLHCYSFFPSTKKRNGRNVIGKDDNVEQHAQALGWQESFSRVSFWIDGVLRDWFARDVWAIAEITEIQSRHSKVKTSTKREREKKSSKAFWCHKILLNLFEVLRVKILQ